MQVEKCLDGHQYIAGEFLDGRRYIAGDLPDGNRYIPRWLVLLSCQIHSHCASIEGVPAAALAAFNDVLR